MRACILERAVHGEKFWRITALSAEEGAVSCLLRQGSKKTGTIVPDLFDEAEITLERRKAGTDGALFVKEYALVARRSGISGNYDGLVFASRFAGILARNAFPPDARAAVFSVSRSAFCAFSEKPRKDAAFFKALWLFARECGLPAREDWFERLAFDDKLSVSAVLRAPLEEACVPAREVGRLAGQLERWLAREHDFVIP